MSSAVEAGRQAFIVEAHDLLAQLEESLLALEEEPDNQELVNRIFRCMHTIKGSGGMFGFDLIESFTHTLENTLDDVRKGAVKVTQNLIDLSLAACDEITILLEGRAKNLEDEGAVRRAQILQGIETLQGGPGSLPTPAHSGEPIENIIESEQEGNSPVWTWLITFVPEKNIFSFGTKPLLLLKELQEMGESRLICHTDKLDSLDKLDPESCYFWWHILLETDRSSDDIRDVFMFVEDDCRLEIKNLNTLTDRTVDFDRAEAVLREKGRLDEDLSAVVRGKERALQKETGSMQKDSDNKTGQGEDSRRVASIRVDAERLDILVNLVGEMVITQARLREAVDTQHDTGLSIVSEEMERLTSELRDISMSMRMVPIGTMFSKFKRLVRDQSRQYGKSIDLALNGGETELDKNVIEKLNDPLVHIIRNAIDHGIEPEANRMVNGKNRKGTITLSAFQAGADVVIEINDDGAGIDPGIVRARALEKGLINESDILTDNELYGLIFRPGFSTKKQATSLSGRGVGMDVVKKNVEALRGSLEVNSTKGKGTSVIIKIPLTLGIIEGLLVSIAGEYYVCPLSVVEECIEKPYDERSEKGASQFINVRGEAVPYIRLRETFEIKGTVPAIEQILITKVNNERVGFAVDEIIREQQVVIKSLGRMYGGVNGVSGATIMGDGSVGMILDVQKLVSMAGSQETNK